MKKLLKKLLIVEESGQAMLEYILLTALVSVFIMLFFAAVMRAGFSKYFNRFARVLRSPLP